MNLPKAALVLCVLTLAAGCEADVDRAERLRHEELLACLPVIIQESGSARQPTEKERAQCSVARRNTNKFMSGR